MKRILFAALAALSLGAGVANAQSLSHGAPAYNQANHSHWLEGNGN